MKTERRAIARYRAKLAVQIDMSEYQFDAITTEVSLRGLRVLCEGPVANTVFNQYIQVTPGANIGANINIKVPNSRDMSDNIDCNARVISVNRIAQNRYMVGFKLIEMDPQSLECWQGYIAIQR
ncbi:MAG: PilZ domain-containing protein [Pseudomonadota bacterium]